MRLLFLLFALTACGGGPQATCKPGSCSGCCTSDDRCIVEVRDRDTNCGHDGASCVNCTTSGKTCSSTTLSCQ